MSESDTPGGNLLAVLLVEDSLEDALLVRTVLEKRLICEVTTIQDGDRGCRFAERPRWGVVITDINIPGRSGLEVIETSKQAAPGRPVVATTAYRGPDYLDAALASGADEVLVKPLDPEELVAQVRALTGARRRDGSGEGADSERSVLAVGVVPGDVERGCGGILMGHRDHGHDVHLLVMSAGGDADDTDVRRTRVERAAGILGVRLLLGEPFRRETPSTDAMRRWLREAVERADPDVLYTPSPNGARTTHLRAHRAAVVECSDIPNHFCYQATAEARDFEPSLFIDVADHLERKVELVEAYRGDGGSLLRTADLWSAARHWGGFIGSPAAEPLEVVRSPA